MKQLNIKKKEKDTTQSCLKEKKVAIVNKLETSSCTTVSQDKRADKDGRTDSKAIKAETTKEMKVGKEVKKENQPTFDIFGDSPTQPAKEEETVIPTFMAVQGINEENTKDPIKTETCEIPIPIVKSEPSSPELCHSTSLTSFSVLNQPVISDSLQDTASQSHPDELRTSNEQPNTVASMVTVKREVQLPSDSDDDFNVDMMLDNLDYVKSECTEGSVVSIKQEVDEEGKNESSAVGAKSKTQVKRVTWNIQEPEGPQPEKSASSKCCC